MLSRLPVELLRLIVREAAPLEYRSSTYKDRRSTLRSLCLVDKRTCAVAQPILAELIEVELPQDGENLDSRGGEEFETSTFLPVPSEAWSRIAPLVWSVVAVAPSDFYAQLPEAFLSLPALRILNLHGALIVSPSTIAPLLSMMHQEQVQQLGDAAIFPQLEALALLHFDYLDDMERRLPIALHPSELFPFMYALFDDSDFTAEDARCTPAIVVLALAETLESTLSILPSNLCLLLERPPYITDSWSPEEAPGHLTDLLVSLRQLRPANAAKSTRLHTLSLPSTFRSATYEALPGLVEARDAVVNLCEEWGTEVLWGEDRLEEYTLIPQAFLNYRRRTIARQSYEGQG
ncbi:hypothetical protein JCM8097_002487 [Rhodosporidiobolus ruineniae]